MSNLKCIFFDIGCTLVDESDVWNKRCQEQSEMSEAKRRGITAKDIYEEIVKASKEYKPQYRTVVKNFNFKESATYRSELEKLYDDTDFVLDKLSKKYKLGIIANQGYGLKERMKTLGILKYFDYIISSWDYKVMKPDVKLFEIALKESGFKSSDTVMVGDRLDNDILPAKSIGMKTIWIKQGFGGMQVPIDDRYIPDREIAELKEIIKIL